MKLQGTSEGVPMCMAAAMEFDAARAATTGGPSALGDDGEESRGPSSTANELPMVCRSDGQLSLDIVPAGYSFSVPLLPEAAPALPFAIVRFVAFHTDVRMEERHPGEDDIVHEKRARLVCDEQAHARLSQQSTVPAAADQCG